MPTRLYFRGLVYDTSSGKLPGSGWDHLGNTEGGYGTTNSGQNGVLGYDLAYNPTTGRYLVVGDSGQTNYETYVAWSDKIDGPWTYYQDPTIYQKTTTGGGINAAIYVPSSGLFVIANDSGVIWTSPNGENGSWTLRYTSPVGLFVNKISIANGIVIVSCPQSTIIYSTDGGLNWTTANVGFTGTANACREVIWDGTRYIAVGQSGQLAYATTLTGTWTQTTVGITNSDCWTIAYSPTLGRYCVGMGNATVRTATSVLVGATWTAATGTFGGSVGMVRWANGRFVACGDGRSIGTSTNGTAFTVTQYNTSTTKADFWGVYNFTGGNTWFAVTEYYPSLVWESFDNGATWQPTGTENSNNAIVAGLASAERKGAYAAGATALSVLSTTANTAATSHVRQSVTSIASTVTQTAFLGIFATSPLASNQTVGGGSIILNAADGESNLNLNFWVNAANIYVWRPSTGQVVGYVRDATNVSLGGTEPTVASTTAVYTTHITGITSTAVSALAGDVVVVELWARFTSGMATAYTANFAFDGAVTTTTENTLVTNHASFIEFTENLTFGNPPISVSRTEALTATDSSNSTVVSAGISASQAESVTADHTQDSTLIEGIEGFVTETVSANHSQDAELIKATVPYTITTGSFKPATEFINSATIPAGTVALGDTVFVLVGGLSWTEYPTTTLWFTDNSTITGTRLAGTLNSPCFALYAFYNIQKNVSFVGIQSGTPGVGNINTYSIWGCPNIYEANQVEGGSPNGTTTTNAPFIDFSSLTASASDNHIAFGVFSINGPIGDTFTQPSGWIAPPTRVGTTGGSATSNNTLAGAWNVFTGTTGTTYTPTINTTRTLSYGGIYYRISNPVAVAITESASATDSSTAIISEGVQESLNATDTLVGGVTEQTFHIEDASNGFVLNTLVGSTSIAYDTSINQLTLLNAIQGIRFISGQTGSLGEVRARLQRSATGNPLPGTPATLRLYSLNNNTLSGTPATALATFSFDIGQISTSGGIYTFDFADITGAQLVAGTAYGLMFEPGSDWSGTQYIQLGYNPSTTALARYSSGLYSYIDGKSSQNTYSTGSNAYMFFAKTTARVTDAVDSEILVNPPSVRTESVTATDSSARVITTSQTRTEAGSAADSQAGSSVRDADTSESVTANDSSSGSVAANAEETESVTADHTQDFTYATNGAVTETGSAVDSETNILAANAWTSNNDLLSVPLLNGNNLTIPLESAVGGTTFIARTTTKITGFSLRAGVYNTGGPAPIQPYSIELWELASANITAQPSILIASSSFQIPNDLPFDNYIFNFDPSQNANVESGKAYALLFRAGSDWTSSTRYIALGRSTTNINLGNYFNTVNKNVLGTGPTYAISNLSSDTYVKTVFYGTEDAETATYTTSSDITEAEIATDEQDSQAFQNNFQEETLTAVDSEDATYTANSSVAETGSANHAQINTLVANAWINEGDIQQNLISTGTLGTTTFSSSSELVGQSFIANKTGVLGAVRLGLSRTSGTLPSDDGTIELWQLSSNTLTGIPQTLLASVPMGFASLGTTSSFIANYYFGNVSLTQGVAYAIVIVPPSTISGSTAQPKISFTTTTTNASFYNYFRPLNSGYLAIILGSWGFESDRLLRVFVALEDAADTLLGGFSAFVDQTDSGAATDEQDSTAFQNNFQDETLTATDSEDSTAAMGVAITETGTVDHAQINTLTANAIALESVTTTDTENSTYITQSDIDEFLDDLHDDSGGSLATENYLLDVLDAMAYADGQHVNEVAIDESVSAAEELFSTYVTNSIVNEAATVLDEVSNVVSFAASLSESVSIQDTCANTVDWVVLISESGSAVDNSTTQVNFLSFVSETVTLADYVESSYVTNAAADEAGAVADEQDSAAFQNNIIDEPVDATDFSSNTAEFAPFISESGFALDTLTNVADRIADINEQLVSDTLQESNSVRLAERSETVNATDTKEAIINLFAATLEAASLQDVASAVSDYVGYVDEFLAAVAEAGVQADMYVNRTEAESIFDAVIATYVTNGQNLESVNSQDSLAETISYVVYSNNTAAANDDALATQDFGAYITETLSALDLAIAGLIAAIRGNAYFSISALARLQKTPLIDLTYLQQDSASSDVYVYDIAEVVETEYTIAVFDEISYIMSYVYTNDIYAVAEVLMPGASAYVELINAA